MYWKKFVKDKGQRHNERKSFFFFFLFCFVTSCTSTLVLSSFPKRFKNFQANHHVSLCNTLELFTNLIDWLLLFFLGRQSFFGSFHRRHRRHHHHQQQQQQQYTKPNNIFDYERLPRSSSPSNEIDSKTLALKRKNNWIFSISLMKYLLRWRQSPSFLASRKCIVQYSSVPHCLFVVKSQIPV